LPPRVTLPADGPPRILFFGRLEPRKGPEVLVRALPAVRAAVPGARLVLAGRDGVASGEPSSRAWLEGEAARLGVADALEFTGQLDTAALSAEIARARVCAFPSRWESFGNVVAEAAAVGRPVVTSTIAPFEDLVDDGVTGRRVRIDDVAGWGAALANVLTDAGRAAAMGAAGADLVAVLADPVRVAAQTVEAHELAVQRHAQGLRAGGRQRGRRR
jgi:glycogen(starch) synthase